PRPVQAHLPILIGGSGPRKTLRTTARYADLWNASGATRDEVVASLDTLREHCADVGRDPAEIELTVSFPISIRDTVEAAKTEALVRFRANGVEDTGPGPHLAGPPELIAEAIAPFVELGFRTVFARFPAPFDRESIERMPEVRSLLDAG
ncbi:MAG TPA: LLM class flavin-dependent oxidoreductase, partial [Candidatus Limnocylindrales bacterium]